MSVKLNFSDIRYFAFSVVMQSDLSVRRSFQDQSEGTAESEPEFAINKQFLTCDEKCRIKGEISSRGSTAKARLPVAVQLFSPGRSPDLQPCRIYFGIRV